MDCWIFGKEAKYLCTVIKHDWRVQLEVSIMVTFGRKLGGIFYIVPRGVSFTLFFYLNVLHMGSLSLIHHVIHESVYLCCSSVICFNSLR